MIGGPIAGRISGRAAYSYTDARYTDYALADASFAGSRIAGVAPHHLQTLLRFSGTKLFLDLESRYQGAVAVNDANSVHSPAYAVHSVRAGLTRVEIARLALAPFLGVDNLLDRAYNSSVVVNAAAGRYFEPGPPRSFYLGADLTLGGR
jgi:iron complex outermembrane recepter protein